jgi:hypothetical protein
MPGLKLPDIAVKPRILSTARGQSIARCLGLSGDPRSRLHGRFEPLMRALGFPATVTGIGIAMHQASANIAEGPSDALPDRVCLPPSVSELLSMVVSTVASPTTRSAPGDVRTLGVVGHRPARMRR